MKSKRVAIQCVIVLWFLLVFIAHYMSIFNNVLLGGAMQVGILGALTGFLKRVFQL